MWRNEAGQPGERRIEMKTRWQDLRVHGEFGDEFGDDEWVYLSNLVDLDDSALGKIVLAADGSISRWPGYFVSAEGEDPDLGEVDWVDWGEVDWAGFAEALSTPAN
jgi:hypothetical protein